MASRNARLASIAEEKDLNRLLKKRGVYSSTIKRAKDQSEKNDGYLTWSKGQINEKISRIDEASACLDKIHMKLVCDFDGDQPANFMQEDEAMDDLVMQLKAKLSDRLDTLEQANRIQMEQANSQVVRGKSPIRVEVQQTDASGNVPNTWGKFDGDYAKWQSFRDCWIAAMHCKTNIKTIVKFTNLKAACVGQARGALGEWDLTEENYHKAWERLQSIYEDDYMQVHAFMHQLYKIPQMSESSSSVIRQLIDTVHKHIHGLKRYVKLDEAHPYVVFAVIDRMDTDTYRAWEKHRPTLAKVSTRAQEANALNNEEGQANPPRMGKHIPTWKQLEDFLESEVTIRVHAEKRRSENENMPSNKNSFKKQANFKHENFKNNRNIPDFLQCTIAGCDEVHPLYRCESFEAMNLNARKIHVIENDLCEQCLRNRHDGRCQNPKSNEECPKCKPASNIHNSMLCPNADLNQKMANEHSFKRRRMDSSSYSEDE